MTYILPGLLLVIFLFCMAFLHREGMFSNAVQLVNVVTAALVAVNFWEPVARMLEGSMPSMTFLYDMVALWGLFALCLVIFRTATLSVSKIRVSFNHLADQIGGAAFAAAIGWVTVCFATMTLHTAPLAEKFMFGGFDPEKKMFFGMLAPDRQFLDFAKMVSKGSYSRWTTREFDPDRDFISRYNDRRRAVEANVAEGGGATVDGKTVGSKIPER